MDVFGIYKSSDETWISLTENLTFVVSQIARDRKSFSGKVSDKMKLVANKLQSDYSLLCNRYNYKSCFRVKSKPIFTDSKVRASGAGVSGSSAVDVPKATKPKVEIPADLLQRFQHLTETDLRTGTKWLEKAGGDFEKALGLLLDDYLTKNMHSWGLDEPQNISLNRVNSSDRGFFRETRSSISKDYYDEKPVLKPHMWLPTFDGYCTKDDFAFTLTLFEFIFTKDQKDFSQWDTEASIKLKSEAGELFATLCPYEIQGPSLMGRDSDEILKIETEVEYLVSKETIEVITRSDSNLRLELAEETAGSIWKSPSHMSLQRQSKKSYFR